MRCSVPCYDFSRVQVGLGRSLYVHLQDAGMVPMLLDTQYRSVHLHCPCSHCLNVNTELLCFKDGLSFTTGLLSSPERASHTVVLCLWPCGPLSLCAGVGPCASRHRQRFPMLVLGNSPVLSSFRMHPAIATFPSLRFYGGRLVSFPKPTDRPAPQG